MTAPLERLDYVELVTTDPPPVLWVIEGVAARGHLALLVGREKVGKSMLALELAARVALGGGELAGLRCHPGRTLIVDGENGSAELHRRVARTGLGLEHTGSFELAVSRGFDLARHQEVLEALVRELLPDLLVIDGFRSTWGGKEVESSEVALALDPLRHLLHATGVAGLLLHHARKATGEGADAYRGGTGIGASVEHIVVLERMAGDPDKQRRRLSNPSSRFAAEGDDRWLRIEHHDDGGVSLEPAAPLLAAGRPRRAAVAERLLEILLRRGSNGTEPPITNADLARAIGLDPKNGTVARALGELEHEGLAERLDPGGWRASPAARLRGVA